MEKIIIDTDPGVDDAFAIILALHAPSIDVKAITTVAGNVDIDNVTRNACTLLEVCNKESIPVYRGSEESLSPVDETAGDLHGEDGMGNKGFVPVRKGIEKEHAVDFLLDYTKKEEDLTILAIGPLTNIAKAVTQDSTFSSRVKKLVIMGGAELGGNVTPAAEFNFHQDPEAAKIVFNAGFKEIVMVGLDATKHVMLTPTLRELIHQIDTPLAQFIYDITEVFVKCQWEWSRILDCELCDIITVGYLLENDILTTKDARVEIETEGLCRGASVVYRTEKYPEKEMNAKVAIHADGKRFFELFFHYLFPEYENEAKRFI